MYGLSVIIAAHNESSGIEQTLRSILANSLDRPLQIIVVANGCSDDTAAKARAFAPAVEVIETTVASKVNALNLGDAAARYYPRAFLDADIELTVNTLQNVVDAFKDSGCHLAAPVAKHQYFGKNFFLAGYYQLWRSLPYVRNAVMGGGFYAIDETLRTRFNQFPAITADDKFIRNLSKPEERRVVEGCNALIRMPESFAALLKVKTRWTYGNLELSETRPDLNVNDRRQHQGAIGYLLARPWLWIHLPTFLFIYAYAQFAARKRFRSKKQSIWDRDQSTRTAPAALAQSFTAGRTTAPSAPLAMKSHDPFRPHAPLSAHDRELTATAR